MSYFAANTTPGLGVQPATVDARFIPSESVSLGRVVEIDIDNDSGDASGVLVGFEGSGMSVVTPSSLDGLAGGLVQAVALEDVASGVMGRFRVRGVARAFCFRAEGTLLQGEGMRAIPGTGRLGGNLVNGDRIRARMLESVHGSAATESLRDVLFDGIAGFGSYYSVDVPFQAVYWLVLGRSNNYGAGSSGSFGSANQPNPVTLAQDVITDPGFRPGGPRLPPPPPGITPPGGGGFGNNANEAPIPSGHSMALGTGGYYK